jgi:hypothetical protein
LAPENGGRHRASSRRRCADACGRDETWAIQQIDRCVRALSDARYATHVPTDDPARLSPLRYRARRLTVAARHIRI